MSGGDETTSDSRSGAPVDFARLDAIRERSETDSRFSRLDEQPEFAPERIGMHV